MNIWAKENLQSTKQMSLAYLKDRKKIPVARAESKKI